jgi:hypothetical protein
MRHYRRLCAEEDGDGDGGRVPDVYQSDRTARSAEAP